MTTPTASPIGPILQQVIKLLWNRLFDNTPGNEIYLPSIIRNGSTSLGLPSYDPAHAVGDSEPFAIDGVPPDVLGTACARDDVKVLPIATTPAELSLGNMRLQGLSNMSPISLSFSTDTPTFAATVLVAKDDTPANVFTATAWDSGSPNYHFITGCCEPVAVGSKTCSANKWNTEASGQFVAQLWQAQITAHIQLNTPASGPPSVKIIDFALIVDPKTMKITFDVKGLAEWARQYAEIAVNEGVSSGALTSGIQTFLNSGPVRGDLEKLVNDQLAKFPTLEAMQEAYSS